MILLTRLSAALLSKIAPVLDRVKKLALRDDKNPTGFRYCVETLVVAIKDGILVKPKDMNWRYVAVQRLAGYVIPAPTAVSQIQISRFIYDDVSFNISSHQHLFERTTISEIPTIELDPAHSNGHQWTQIFPSGMSIVLESSQNIEVNGESVFITTARATTQDSRKCEFRFSLSVSAERQLSKR